MSYKSICCGKKAKQERKHKFKCTWCGRQCDVLRTFEERKEKKEREVDMAVCV